MKVMDGQRGKRCSDEEYLTYTHKRCGDCGKVKAVKLFRKRKTKTARGWSWDSHCIDCRRRQCREYGAGNREKRNARLRQYRRNNPEAIKRLDRRRRLRSKYDLTEAEHEQMRSDQNGCCAICGDERDDLFVDHCHTTGKVRGLLCPKCNTFLGWYERNADQILNFQRYIDTERSA